MTVPPDTAAGDQRYATLRLERRDPLALVWLDRPEKLNAMNRQMKQDILAVLDTLRDEPDARALIIGSAVPRAFCAGADIAEFQSSDPVGRWQYERDQHRRIFEEIERFPKPVIAMIHGYAVGGGCELALACDLRVASEDAQIGLTELRFGMIPGAGGTQRLARLVGQGKAMQLVLTAEPVPARDAREIGLVEEVVPREQLEAVTVALAEKIVRHAPIATEAAKLALRNADRNTLEGGLQYEVALSTLCFATEDKEEAIRAFLEGREPRYTGR